MYELSARGHFAAAHRLRGYQGECENLHGHNWQVEVRLAGRDLDELGMLVDFRDLKRELKDILQVLDHKYLNDVPPFDQINPTTENICRYIAGEMAGKLPRRVSIRRVTCWESEGCSASYLPPE